MFVSFELLQSRNENTYSLELSRKIPILPDIGALGTQYGALLFMAAERSRDFQPQQSSVLLIRRNIGILLSDITHVLLFTHTSMKTFTYPIIPLPSTRKEALKNWNITITYIYVVVFFKKRSFYTFGL